MSSATKIPADLVTSVNAWWQWWLKDDSGHQVDILPGVFPLALGDQVYAELFVIDSNTVQILPRERMRSVTVFPAFDLTPPTPTAISSQLRGDRGGPDGGMDRRDGRLQPEPPESVRPFCVVARRCSLVATPRSPQQPARRRTGSSNWQQRSAWPTGHWPHRAGWISPAYTIQASLYQPRLSWAMTACS